MLMEAAVSTLEAVFTVVIVQADSALVSDSCHWECIATVTFNTIMNGLGIFSISTAIIFNKTKAIMSYEMVD